MSGNSSDHGGYSFSFNARNSFSFNANHSFSFSGAQPLDAYGFDGFPGNPMLAAGLANARSAALRGKLPLPGEGWGDPGREGLCAATALPPFESLPPLGRLGRRPRAALALMELLGRIKFAADGDTLTLEAQDSAANLQDLIAMQCPGLDFFKAQLPKVDVLFTEREIRTAEILTQVTPPISYFASVLNLQAGRHAHTLELLDVLLQFAYAVCMRFKLAFGCPRPSELSAAIQPMLEVPPHAAYPMGHANEAYVLAGVLGALLPTQASMARNYLRRVAFRIGENRIVAGLHYPVDGVAGRLLGDTLAQYLVACCRGGVWESSALAKSALGPASGDLYLDDVAECGDHGSGKRHSHDSPPVAEAPTSGSPFAVLRMLWAAADAEWREPVKP